MEVKELMIGDSVFSPDDEKDIRITACDLFMMENGNPRESRFEPIPLNEEWLLKFNLEQEFDRFYFQAHGNEYSIRISKTGGRLYGCGNNAIPVYTISELQNLYFALTQKELSLKDENTL